jgi:hypothetical protein
LSKWKDEDWATPEFIEEYLHEFREGIANNPTYKLNEKEKAKVEQSLKATEKFCTDMVKGRKNRLYMHDLILMAIGFYGGHLTALEPEKSNPPAVPFE